MSHRIGRVAHIIRDVVSDAIVNRISDPRVSRFTSITRVELSPDLRVADVYFSVMGPDNDGRTTMKGLESARGMIQSCVAKSLDMRQCPSIRLHLDLSLKKAAYIVDLIDQSNPSYDTGPIGSAECEDEPDDRAENSPTQGDCE